MEDVGELNPVNQWEMSAILCIVTNQLRQWNICQHPGMQKVLTLLFIAQDGITKHTIQLKPRAKNWACLLVDKLENSICRLYHHLLECTLLSWKYS